MRSRTSAGIPSESTLKQHRRNFDYSRKKKVPQKERSKRSVRSISIDKWKYTNWSVKKQPNVLYLHVIGCGTFLRSSVPLDVYICDEWRARARAHVGLNHRANVWRQPCTWVRREFRIMLYKYTRINSYYAGGTHADLRALVTRCQPGIRSLISNWPTYRYRPYYRLW